ncbi:MAG: hypothetical protein ACI4MC_03570 [Candidatus Coproplasma sp.]
MIKILILFAIVILSALLGAALSADKKRQYKTVCEFYDFNESLILNIKYERKRFDEVAKGYENVKKALAGEEVLSGEEGKFIKKYLEGIGTTDAQSQISYLMEMKETLAKYKNESEKKYKKYGSLYLKLCIACGILIDVLLA